MMCVVRMAKESKNLPKMKFLKSATDNTCSEGKNFDIERKSKIRNELLGCEWFVVKIILMKSIFYKYFEKTSLIILFDKTLSKKTSWHYLNFRGFQTLRIA